MDSWYVYDDLCAGNAPVTGKFPSYKASDAELLCIHWFDPEQTGE